MIHDPSTTVYPPSGGLLTWRGRIMRPGPQPHNIGITPARYLLPPGRGVRAILRAAWEAKR